MPPGDDPLQHGRTLEQLHDSFVSTGSIGATLRPMVSESWRRSMRPRSRTFTCLVRQ